MTERKKLKNKATDAAFNSSSVCLTLDQIFDYLDGQTDQFERKKIEEHLRVCPLCADATEGYRSISNRKKSQRWVETVENDLSRRLSKKKTTKSDWKKYYSIAAVLLLVSTIIFYIFNMMTHSEPGLFETYFVPFPNTTPIVRSEQQANRFLQAMSAYEMEDYATALNLLKAELSNNAKNTRAQFYAAMACLKLGNVEQAIRYLQTVLSAPDSEYYQHSQWYLSLAYLKSEDYQRAAELLQKIVNNNPKYKKRASELLEVLTEK
jgi:TolA-binding protein